MDLGLERKVIIVTGVSLLLSPLSSYITGSSIDVSGGLNVR